METQIKRLAVVGSTGSIGQQTLDVIRALPQRFQVVALAAGKNIELLTRQVAEFKPKFAYYADIGDDEAAAAQVPELDSELLQLEDIVSLPEVDTVVMAVSGEAGLSPTLAAIKAGKQVALANKESLVAAGEIITGEAKLSGAQILPVDSEHSAIWQCLNGETQAIDRIILTASGGPFLNHSSAQLKEVTVEQALAHPSWQMGKKVTIDSATLMNKGLEVIEAHWLFDVPFNNIEIIIHPQSIVHSMVEFADGSIKAQLSCPDMRLPIQYALSYPERVPNPQLQRLDWSKINSLNFQQPDMDRFPCLRLAIEAGERGGTYPAVLCAADEVAVALFLSGSIGFTDIARLIERVLEQHQAVAHPAMEDIEAADAWAREKTLGLFNGDNLCWRQ